jgi:arginyl-tRNA synthetase
MTSVAHYPLDPCRADLGEKIYAELCKLVPAGSSPSLSAVEIARLLEQPPDSKMGDYALPCFRFAKDTKKKPIEVAEALGTSLKTSGWLDRCHTVGAFLNIFINKQVLAKTVVPEALSGLWFSKLAKNTSNNQCRVMIEYSQPNTHKEFHVGHGRNVCLGNSLVRLYRYCGYNVLAANYYGDDGAHIARILRYVKAHKLAFPSENRGEWLGQIYVKAGQEFAAASDDEKQRITAQISEVHRDIETKHGETFKLWQDTRQWSLDDFAAIYKWLDVHFDILFYESELTEESQSTVSEYLAKGIFVEDQGAIGVDLKPYKLGFCILRKSDGNTLYATKDLALAKRKFENHKIDRSIYVVADEQNHHFRQVFKVLELMGFAQAKLCYHLSYGMVVLPEGKMSSRDGTSVTFNSLKALMLTHLRDILKKYENDWSPAEITETAHRLCDGAIKYGMISTDPSKEIVFNLEDWLSFEGNSGPYLMYSYSRTKSILRKAAEQGFTANADKPELLKEDSEHELMRFIYDINLVVATACENYKPSSVANHLFYMCKSFNRFYADVSVLKADSADLRSARLALIQSFANALSTGLSLLGIVAPERM